MIYPPDFETKSGFNTVRSMLRERCLCTLGRDKVDTVTFLTDTNTINTLLQQTAEMRSIIADGYDFPLHHFYDMRTALARTRLEGSYMDENELFQLRRSLATICDIVRFTAVTDDNEQPRYPALHTLAAHINVPTDILRTIDNVIDSHAHIKDNASPLLANIRTEHARTAAGISHTLNTILRKAQTEGYVDKDAAPTVRDGRLVIPVTPAMKRRIRGIVHDESASGKTVFIEPTEAVEANNRIRELEAEEQRERIRILTNTTAAVRPHTNTLTIAYDFLANIDLIQAKATLADTMHAADTITVEKQPVVDWTDAYHPLLRLTLEKQSKTAVPLDITLTDNTTATDDTHTATTTKQGRMIIISGPNAGGKSVCLRTVALLQYMIQSGLPVPAGNASRFGTFETLMIDIGDGQNIDNDMSTYSSHLTAMKTMMRHASPHTLLLIDEFGSGTEPQIGGAIAEAVLRQLCEKNTFGVITTHYHNLKHFADNHDDITNAAMLYDRHTMTPLFRLAIGQPGSSFAIDMARKTGLPDNVIADAGEIAGNEYIKSDKYLQDIVRDKRYWEEKRQNIRRREKDIERLAARYEHDIEEIENARKDIIKKAREQAEELLRQSNRTIENTIREIRECQAEREQTKLLRRNLDTLKDALAGDDNQNADDDVTKKMQQIKERKARHERRRAEKEAKGAQTTDEKSPNARQNEPKRATKETLSPLKEGDTVRIKGAQSVGRVASLRGGSAFVVFGTMRTKVVVESLERADERLLREQTAPVAASPGTRAVVDERRDRFRHDLDVRGMRGDEALTAVSYFIDDAIMLGITRVRILHGKGDGILRQLIRDYLSGVPNVKSCRDEHVQFGGAGITVVDL